MKNSDRFLAAFNSIEISLRKYAEEESFVPFSRLIQKAFKTDAIINRYYNDLKEFSELRNAIVHNTIDVNAAIAEPHDIVVEKIEYIDNEIKQPKRVIPLFEKNVTKFNSNDTLKDILYAINQYDFSKFPVYENKKFIGLLTKKEIVNWLAKNIEHLDSISYDTVNLKDVLAIEENHEKPRKRKKKHNNYLFVSKQATIYDVKDTFRKGSNSHAHRVDAILITEHANPSEALLGIITPWDLIDLDDNI